MYKLASLSFLSLLLGSFFSICLFCPIFEVLAFVLPYYILLSKTISVFNYEISITDLGLGQLNNSKVITWSGFSMVTMGL